MLNLKYIIYYFTNCFFLQVRKLKRCITLEELKAHKEGPLQGLTLLTAGRLSVQRVSSPHWDFILSLEDQDPAK